MTTEIVLVFVVLGATVFLFVSEWLRVDVVALLTLLALAWLGLVEPRQALAGFSSNAVMSIIGVMVLGHGIDRTGIMAQLTRPLLRMAGSNESRLVALVMAAVGSISAVMQNIGAAALFLPALLRISKQRRLPASRLLMPVGFAAILGGTLTMVASGPLIILNDLLSQNGLATFGLFDVTPVGLMLLVAGIAYFALFGRWVLPTRASASDEPDPQRQLVELWRLPQTIHGCMVPESSPLVGTTVEESGVWGDYSLNLLALRAEGDTQDVPWRHTRFAAGQELALLGQRADFERFLAAHALKESEATEAWVRGFKESSSRGFAEFIVHPRASILGKTLREVQLRKTYGVEPLMLLSKTGDPERNFSDVPFEAGSALVGYGRWENLRTLSHDRNFFSTTPIEVESTDPSKGPLALAIFAIALALAVSGFPLSIALLSGAVAMVLLRVVPMDAAYQAIDWRTVFLLAGLIPLGTAMEQSGAATYVATELTAILQGSSPVVLMVAVALLATLFSLFMSNVAATVLLVPLVLVIGKQVGVDGRALALLVAVAASNSFILPTHQVNALFAAPGGYRNADFIRAGGVMTGIFLLIVVGAVWLLFGG